MVQNLGHASDASWPTLKSPTGMLALRQHFLSKLLPSEQENLLQILHLDNYGVIEGWLREKASAVVSGGAASAEFCGTKIKLIRENPQSQSIVEIESAALSTTHDLTTLIAFLADRIILEGSRKR